MRLIRSRNGAPNVSSGCKTAPILMPPQEMLRRHSSSAASLGRSVVPSSGGEGKRLPPARPPPPIRSRPPVKRSATSGRSFNVLRFSEHGVYVCSTSRICLARTLRDFLVDDVRADRRPPVDRRRYGALIRTVHQDDQLCEFQEVSCWIEGSIRSFIEFQIFGALNLNVDA